LKLHWRPKARQDYEGWDHETRARINELIDDIVVSPFKGTGKPEPLKYKWAGWWSRRITKEHRLVYRVSGKPGEQVLEIAQCRFHY